MSESFPAFDPDYEPESVGLRWDDYKKDFRNFMVAKCNKKFNDIAAEVKTASFLHYVGKKVSRLFRTRGNEDAAYADIIDQLDGYYVKAINSDYERYTFSLARQAKNESFDAFVNRLRVLATNCNFADSKAEIRTRIIHGCYSEQLRVKALAENLDADKHIL